MRKLIKGIKRAAFWRWIDGYGYAYSERKILWQSKSCSWNIISLTYGIRRSDINQWFPIWNVSHNSERALMFGFAKWFVTIAYHRRKPFNQDRKLPKNHRLRKLIQLIN